MSSTVPIAALGLEGGPPQLTQLALPAQAAAPQTGGTSFASILQSGLQTVDQKLVSADALVRQFAVDDSVPVHQVMIALEEAKDSVELAMQVRARLVQTYRDLMTMQL